MTIDQINENASFADCHGQETALMPLMDMVMI